MSAVSGSSSPPPLNEERFAPLKRNHACLQCKKRKVKCDAVHPTCSPCMRSYAHAVRAAQRNKTSPPALVCTYAENDSNAASDDESQGMVIDHDGSKRKKRPRESGEAHRPRESPRDEERDALMARIAELENRLNGLTPSDSNSSDIRHVSRPSTSAPSKLTTPSTGIISLDDTSAWLKKATTGPTVQPPVAPPSYNFIEPALPTQETPSITNDSFDFGSYFMIPMNWPVGLPSPFLLEHLLETFFNCVPHFPRLLHKPSLLARVRLPPTSPNFPHASLLHAICAIAAPHTAWVHSVPPEMIEETLSKNATASITNRYGLDETDDFALNQGEMATRSIKSSMANCMMGPGTMMLEVAQASVILAEMYFNKSIPLQAWMVAAFAPRLLCSLEIMNKNRGNPTKDPLIPEPTDSFDREQRYATVWVTFIQDSGFSLNSFWGGGMAMNEIHSPFPAKATHFNGKEDNIPINPQSLHSKGMISQHPVEDPFVLASKASTLVWRSAEWIRAWTQRDVVPGDHTVGLARPDLNELLNDIRSFQASIPSSMKNIFRVIDQSSEHTFNNDIITIHVLPNLALVLVYESLVDWEAPNAFCVQQMQKALEAILGVLCLIPSNLDVCQIFTSMTAFSIYTTGRVIANFCQRAIDIEQYGVAMRYRADLQTVQNLLTRYGQKCALGLMTSRFLEAYLTMASTQKINSRTCIDVREYEAVKAGERERAAALAAGTAKPGAGAGIDVSWGLGDNRSSSSSTSGLKGFDSASHHAFCTAKSSTTPVSTCSCGQTPPMPQTVTPDESNNVGNINGTGGTTAGNGSIADQLPLVNDPFDQFQFVHPDLFHQTVNDPNVMSNQTQDGVDRFGEMDKNAFGPMMPDPQLPPGAQGGGGGMGQGEVPSPSQLHAPATFTTFLGSMPNDIMYQGQGQGQGLNQGQGGQGKEQGEAVHFNSSYSTSVLEGMNYAFGALPADLNRQ